MPIYDTDGHGLLSASFALRSGEQTTCAIQIDCLTGYALVGTSVDNIVVEARHDIAGSWVDIESTPIDLGTWNGSREVFQVRLTAGMITRHTPTAFALTVKQV